ncbi:MAG: DNA mismatch repair protein MutS [Bacteroidetes bacterium]|nr:DNA mismatch repair protein MutS [Bacteroidota bacterium]
MRQFYALKQKYPDALLLFRVGDFYETFGDDAIKTADILGITLTKRANGAASHVELAGFPYHALDTYLPKLVRSGTRVAVCDQLEDPKATTKIVKRGVTQVLSPGTASLDKTLDQRANNFLAAIHFGHTDIGVAFCDLSTGEFYLGQGSTDFVDTLLQSLNPSEVLHSKAKQAEFSQRFGNKVYTYFLEDWLFSLDYAREKLLFHFKTQTLKGYGVDDLTEGIVAAGVVLHYLNDNKYEQLRHLLSLRRLQADDAVWLDRFTVRNLELVAPAHPDGKCLVDVLDSTLTPMGGRQLRKWILMPLKDIAGIERRQKVVATLLHEPFGEQVMRLLRPMGDLERLISKVAMQRVNPRELGHIKRALDAASQLKTCLEVHEQAEVKALADQMHHCQHVRQRIQEVLTDDPPLQTNKGGLIREGVLAELDEYRNLALKGKDYLVELQRKEMLESGINSLKIGFNNVFGYYLEVRNTHKDKVPPHWVRKQTLVGAERYITPELKAYEEKILLAEEKYLELEQRVFGELVNELADYIEPIQQNSNVVAKLDVLLSFARVATANGYVCPLMDDSRQLDIKDGRHPVIEKALPLGQEYVPNDVFLDNDSQQLVILTGPNMSGKSAYLRQTALMVLMAQMGSYVPASSARIGLIDKIFTRVGASDNLSAGESTFMVEMTETASILNNFTPRSLILLDEIGRGTSTYDGVSIAWAITEYLAGHPYRPKTIFATHYHELNEIAEQHEKVRNYHVTVKEVKGQVVFIRKLQPGGSAHSFGIHVAKLAGVPQTVVNRANDLLALLEDKQVDIRQKDLLKKAPRHLQMNLFEMEDPTWARVREELLKLDVNSTTPMEALMKISYLKSLLAKKA